ncbi:DUF2332 domain-containing protein [Yoonia sp. 208BN28-4]|uniref:DUF2332 domain-containing protein n=1 Tax=Yoonia sp. 208BN28-4 TaxID=3126505 RepID=UPI0030ABDD84
MIPAHVAEAFAYQARACADLGSPFMAQLCGLFATRPLPDTALRHRIYTWDGDLSPRGASVPLRLCGALHALKLKGDPALDAIYPPHSVDDATLWEAVSAACITHEAFIDRWIDSPPQTNEVRRSAALIAAGNWLTDHYGLPIQTSELGASGGLNLMWDHFALEIAAQRFGPSAADVVLRPEWSGPLPPQAQPRIVARRGVDLNPLNPRDPDDALRLRAYLWPDQPDRLTLTGAAIAINETAVAQADAIDWLANHLDQPDDTLHLIYHTIAWQYFPADVQARGERLIVQAGENATPNRPLAWLGMEPDDGTPGAALTLRIWPENKTIALGRVDFHGRWVQWQATPKGASHA